jgi:hypothetical protein
VTLSALLFGAPAKQRGEGMAVELPPLPSRGELGIKPQAEQALLVRTGCIPSWAAGRDYWLTCTLRLI